MGERDLEERMHAFLAGDADVLVSTTIIESGIDIPQANTLIVERADTLGLSQLYQIRGRVGRSDVTAHAYLFYPDASELTPEARARLATLADHTELGAGFQIAMRDLEIRGAGDLLGAEQSGHVAALGFELYVEMLNEAVAELSGQARAAVRPVRVDARVDAFIPASYVSSEALKIDMHRRLALVEHDDELRELRAGVEDRYGPLPEPVENLFSIQEAKLKLALIGADYLVYRGGRVTVGPARPRLRRAAGPAGRRRHPRLHAGEARGEPPHGRSQGGARTCRCYSRGAFGRLRTAIPGASRRIPTDRNCELTRPRLYIHRLVSATPTRESPSMKPTRIAVAALVALVVLVATACGGSDQTVPDDAVAVVDGVPVTKAELDGLLARAKATYKTQKRAFPKAGTAEYQSLQTQAVAFLVQRAEYDNRAAELKLDGDRQGDQRPDRPDQEAVLRRQPEEARQAAEGAGLHDESLRADIRRRSSPRRSTTRSPRTRRSRTRHREVLQAEQGQYSRPRAATSATSSSRPRPGRHALRQLKAGANFAALAKKSRRTGSRTTAASSRSSEGQTVAPFDRLRSSSRRTTSRPGEDPVRLPHDPAALRRQACQDDAVKDVRPAIEPTLLDKRRRTRSRSGRTT